MRNVPMTLAAAVSVVAFSYATTSRADDDTTVRSQSSTTTQTTTQATPSTTTTTVQPSTTAPTTTQSTTTVQTTPPMTGTTTTTAAPYAPVPMGSDTYTEATTEYRPNRPLLTTGAGIFVIAYGASAITAAVSPLDADDKLFIPLVGPWLDLNDRPSGGNNEDLNKALIITSGVAQGVGVLLALSSLVIPETHSTAAHTETTAKAKPPKSQLHVAPMSYRGGAGVGALGTF